MAERGVLCDLVRLPNERLKISLCICEPGIQILVIVIRIGQSILLLFFLLVLLLLLLLAVIAVGVVATLFHITSTTRGMMCEPIILAVGLLLLPPALDGEELLHGAFFLFQLGPDLGHFLFLEVVDLAELIIEMLDKGGFVGIVPAGRVCFLELFLFTSQDMMGFKWTVS